ncbi:unnamed protein product [Larinioides sclopetarius]|uniref:Uncharacterized protein n=1 Tax=Larinioides sclopetarius TaxID=280406 RepID=A0AAV2AI04_9ARAC
MRSCMCVCVVEIYNLERSLLECWWRHLSRKRTFLCKTSKYNYRKWVYMDL